MGLIKDVVDFDAIDEQKENIVPQRQGRSARVLRQVLSSKSSEIQNICDDYEAKLKRTNEECISLEGLGIYTEYIEWLKNVHHQGPNAKLLRTIERFIEESNGDLAEIEVVKNDQRCLNIWLYYIDTFFGGSQQERRDIFIFMFRNQIGRKLAKYYIEFSKLLFEMKRYRECYDFLIMGSTLHAQPSELIADKILELEEVLQEGGIELGRQELLDRKVERLLEKYGNIKILDKDLHDVLKMKNTATTATESAGTKLQIHMDNPTPSKAKGVIFRDDEYTAWQPKSERLQENSVQATPLIPDTKILGLKQERDSDDLDVTHPEKKLSVFNDNIGRVKPVYSIIRHDNNMVEKLDCNLELLYRPTQELSLEHLLAMRLGYYHPKRKREDDPMGPLAPVKKPNTSIEKPGK